MKRTACLLISVLTALLTAGCPTVGGLTPDNPDGGSSGVEPSQFTGGQTAKDGTGGGGGNVGGDEVVVRPAPKGGELGGSSDPIQGSASFELLNSSSASVLEASYSNATAKSLGAQLAFELDPGQTALLTLRGLDKGSPQLDWSIGKQNGTIALKAVDNPPAAATKEPTATLQKSLGGPGHRNAGPARGVLFSDGAYSALLSLRPAPKK
jgi:predicted small secreted protein